jgi:hypothetical protein
MSRTLTVYLAADLKRFSPALKGAEQDLGRFGNATRNLSNSLSGMLGPAMIAAGAAAGYAAVQFGVDGVKAFIDDEAAAAKLAKTLDNLGLAHDTTQVEGMIDALQRETGVADDALRPAFDRLVRSIGDTKGATDALKLAMDVSAGTGKSLDSVVQALGKAYDGNTTGLGRLGAGIDKATLATGDMDLITQQLARTFGGQAATAANTYQGQLDRLAVGFGELQESFGKGFTNAMTEAEDKTDGLMTSMQKLEPTMEKLGEKSYETAEGFAQAGIDAVSIFDAINQGDWRLAWQIIAWGEDSVAGYTKEVREAAAATYGLDKAWATMGGGTFADDISATEAATSRWNAAAIANGATIKTNGGNLKDYFATLNQTSTASGSAAKETDLLTTAFELQKGVIDDLQVTLDTQVADLERNTQAAKDYSSTLATQLLGGIDLGAAQQTGADLGISSLDAFDRQIEQHEWFGNVLTAIRSSGADQRLIDQIAALGPEAGGKLGQEMLDKGLVEAFNSRLESVTALANTTATAMAGEFFPAGTEAATGMVDNTLEQMGKEAKRLKAIGKNMGDLIGKTMAAEIAEAVAKAVAAAEAAKTAAAAERAAQQAARAVVTSEQQIAQTVVRLINNSNARAGYSMGVPVPTPVLG